MEKINFYLPDFYFHKKLNLTIIELLNNHPEYFYDNVKIKAVYGSFPNAIWNGGRQINGIVNSDFIKKTIEEFNALGVSLHFTYTNCLLEEKHTYDTYCNMIMNFSNNGENGIIINSPVLEEYLRKNYPNFKYIYSTTTEERDINKINQACKNYDIVVPDYRDTIDDNFISALEEKDKIEILINAYCNSNCRIRQLHYRDLSFGQLNYTIVPSVANTCNTHKRNFIDTLKLPTVIKVEDLYNKYIDLGFNHFKIEGRLVHPANVIESYIYYLIKPEYQNEIRLKLLIDYYPTNF